MSTFNINQSTVSQRKLGLWELQSVLTFPFKCSFYVLAIVKHLHKKYYTLKLHYEVKTALEALKLSYCAHELK